MVPESNSDDDGGENGDTRDRYRSDEVRTLSLAIVDAVEAHKDVNLAKSGLTLYDAVDPDALNELFTEDARPAVTVQFEFDDVHVRLWGDNGVEIQVTDQSDGS